MNRTYGINEPSPSHDELEAYKREVSSFLTLWKKRAAIATFALLLSCASVVPFLAGHPLHRYWDGAGKYLVMLSMGLLIPWGFCVQIAANSWFAFRGRNENG